MKRLFLIVIAVLLIVAASAQAKGLKWVEVCGPTDCNRTSAADINFERSPLIFPPWVMSGGPDKPPRKAGEWLRIRVAVPHSDRRMRSVVIPARATPAAIRAAATGSFGSASARLLEAPIYGSGVAWIDIRPAPSLGSPAVHDPATTWSRLIVLSL